MHVTACFNAMHTASTYGTGCRFDSSLGMLTKKFLSLIEKAEDGILDLNQAADELQVRVPCLLRLVTVVTSDTQQSAFLLLCVMGPGARLIATCSLQWLCFV